MAPPEVRVPHATHAQVRGWSHDAMSEKVVVYFDYLCPFAWRGAEIAEWVGEPLGLSFEWRHFSIFQADYPGRDGWQLWNEPLDDADGGGCKGLLPFLASCAARRQGTEAADRFRLALLRARHRDGEPFDLPTVQRVAERASLHMAAFERDLSDPELRTQLAQEHHKAVCLDVFGTPTFAFPDGDIAYLRARQLPRDRDEAVRLFSSFRGLLRDFPYLDTVRRPRPKRN